MQILILIYMLEMYANSRNFRVFGEIGVQEHDGDSDFRPEVEIWPYRTCAMKNMQYNPFY